MDAQLANAIVAVVSAAFDSLTDEQIAEMISEPYRDVARGRRAPLAA